MSYRDLVIQTRNKSSHETINTEKHESQQEPTYQYNADLQDADIPLPAHVDLEKVRNG